ncbi:MAG TPA: glycosyltransferase [Oscillospiraceae bacterium]|nr:glycosyltransferase [Oscillospiraceae bacterium]
MKDCLVLLTKTYPFGTGEEFIENEMPILAQKFSKIILIATSVSDPSKRTRPTPKNVNVHGILRSTVRRSLPMHAISVAPFCGYGGYANEIEKNEVRHSVKRKLFLTGFLAQGTSIYQRVSKILVQYELSPFSSLTFYSYWFYDTAFAAVKLKKKFGGVAVSRAHGYDLYTNRNSLNYLPLRSYLLQNLDCVRPCSKQGVDYLTKLYPAYQEKILCSYLGTKDHGISPSSEDDTVRFVSCAFVCPVKRLNLLASAFALLKECPKKIRWTHFGNGDGLEELKQYAQDHLGFMEYDFPGFIKNEDLLEYYHTHSADWFLNVSSSEGLPVSIMEAASCGIPAIATNVGGTSELVINGKTGFLLSADLTPEALAEKLSEVMELPKEEAGRMRTETRKTWETTFQADKNYENFIEDIKELNRSMHD